MKEDRTIIVNPDKFVVPYAESADGRVFQLKDGRPRETELFCPICVGRVSFVSETDQRAAHFRHHSRSDCDRIAGERAETLHNLVVDVTAEMLRSGTEVKKICTSHSNLPSGECFVEKSALIDGFTHRPDITVEPAEGEDAATLEMEVVLTHSPEPERLERAAKNGRLVAVLNIQKLCMEYNNLFRENAHGKIRDVCRYYILNTKYQIKSGASIRRCVRGFIEGRSKYLDAQLRDRIHANNAHQLPRGNAPFDYNAGTQAVSSLMQALSPHGTSAGGRPITWTGKVVSEAEWHRLSEQEKHGPSGPP